MPPLAAQTTALIHQLPHYVHQLQDRNSTLGRLNTRYHVQQRIASLITTKGSSLVGGVLGAGALVLEGGPARPGRSTPDHAAAPGKYRCRGSRERAGVLRPAPQSGVLVRTRHSSRDPGQVTGYAVALPGDTARGGDQVWYGGGKLAADLSLPKLRQRWPRPGAEDRFTAAERSAAWEHAAQAVDRASAHIRELLTGSDPGAAADAAQATSGTLHAAAAALGSRALRQAADAYNRAARAPYGRIPPPTPAGDGLRRAARLLSAYGYITSDPSFRPLVLIVRLAVLAEAVADLRQSQQHAAQAAGALRAAQQLRAARGIYAAPASAGQQPAKSAATLAGAGFPAPPSPDPATLPAPDPPRPRPPAPPGPGQQPRRQ